MSSKTRLEESWGLLGMKFNTYKMEDALESIIDYRGKTPKKSDFGIMTLTIILRV